MSARRATRRLRARALAALVLALCACAAPPAHAATPRASLTTIERQVMCVTCKIPLDVAQSPQSDRERAYIQSLIDSGENEAQVKRALVGQYGQAVLALPAAHGFDLAAYLVPATVVVALAGLLLALLPRWRRRAAAEAARERSTAALGAEDAARLDADLARFD